MVVLVGAPPASVPLFGVTRQGLWDGDRTTMLARSVGPSCTLAELMRPTNQGQTKTETWQAVR